MTTIVRQRGIVLDRVSLQPLAEARVDAFDANGQILHAVARAVTDAQGLFELRMTLDEIEGLFGEGQG